MAKKIKTDTVAGSAYWASYLINGDASGIEDRDIALADAWLASLPEGAHVVSCDDEAYFSWSYGTTCGDDSCQGGDLLNYQILIGE